jgi:hypothetical protein
VEDDLISVTRATDMKDSFLYLDIKATIGLRMEQYIRRQFAL